jgi:hypothetical protein
MTVEYAKPADVFFVVNIEDHDEKYNVGIFDSFVGVINSVIDYLRHAQYINSIPDTTNIKDIDDLQEFICDNINIDKNKGVFFDERPIVNVYQRKINKVHLEFE